MKQFQRLGGRRRRYSVYSLARSHRELYHLMHAAAQDAGNTSMRIHNRTSWDEEDFNAAVAEFNRLFAVLPQNAARNLGV